LRSGVGVAALLIPLQIAVGDAHGLNTLHYQPAKIAAMEGIWHAERRAPLLLFALPDDDLHANRFELKVPDGASLILMYDADGELQGVDDFGDKHPPVFALFWAFRIMVGVGVLMLAVSWGAAWMLRRAREPQPWMARVLVAMTFAGWLATLAGWYVTEIGRQPYLVYGVLTTAQATSTVPGGMIATSLALYLCLYVALIFSFVTVVFHLARKGGGKAPLAWPAVAQATAQGAHHE
jgi:cytochrome d ubiquinol oxidase subunit I